MPGVLILEALAQAAGLLALMPAWQGGLMKNNIYDALSVSKVRFKRPVEPGGPVDSDHHLY